MTPRMTPGLAAIALAVVACAAPPERPAAQTSWVTRSAIYEVFVRDFSPSGNLEGVRLGLDRIQATGADVVWLMPIHPVGVLNRKELLGSPYSGRDYRAIDSAFGSHDDFRALVAAVHERGMKLILDWVPNHTAWDHRWVTEHPDFYVRDSSGGLTVPRDDKGQLTNWTDVAQLDYGNPALRREMIAAMRYWLEEMGIDGFRVDVAGFVPDDFWEEAVPALRAPVNRPILLLAEWGDLKMHRFGFDLTYGWDGYHAIKAVWKGDSAAAFVRKQIEDQQAMPPGGMRLRFTTNHDETGWDQPPVALFGGSAGARAAFVAMAFLPGRPLLYNGQEVESPQKLRLFYRDPVEWNQPAAEDARAFYRKVVELARSEPFISGPLRALTTSAPADVIAYARGDVVILVNTRNAPRSVTVSDAALGGKTDLLSGRIQPAGNSFELPAYGAAVFKRE